jgi:hypothetical protein
LEVRTEVDWTFFCLEELLEWREDDLGDSGQVSIRATAATSPPVSNCPDRFFFGLLIVNFPRGTSLFLILQLFEVVI